MPNKNKEKADFNGKIHHVQWTNKEKDSEMQHVSI